MIHVGFGQISPDGSVLTIGACYKVHWYDCCSNGGFAAELTEVHRSDPNDLTSIIALSFNNGVTCTGVTLELVPRVHRAHGGDNA